MRNLGDYNRCSMYKSLNIKRYKLTEHTMRSNLISVSYGLLHIYPSSFQKIHYDTHISIYSMSWLSQQWKMHI